ncbi:hypothetical protein CBS14141_002085 [Malassezia furfur]|nr:hypothetical protein CBS14141_002085 [Malassezia furfur]
MDIALSSDALDVAFHPDEDKHLLAVGLISGKVQLFDYSALVNQDAATDAPKKRYKRLWSVRPSHKSCRGVTFDANGSHIYAIFKDGSLMSLDPRTGEVLQRVNKAHDSAPSRILSVDAHLLVTGDDDGVVRLWDPALASEDAKPIQSYDHHTDWITDLLWCTNLEPARTRSKDQAQKRKRDESSDRDARSRLVCTSGDGTLSVIDVRSKKKAVEVSDDQEDELLGKKLVVGTQLGILSLWAPSRGLLDHVDRFPGHPSSVDAICTLDDDTVLTGSSDGLIRVVQLFPHKLLGIVADHDGMPVEVMRKKGHFIASLGHGSECKLTDLRPLLEGDEDEEVDEEAVVQVDIPAVARSAEVSDDSDSSDDEAPPEQRRRGATSVTLAVPDETLDTEADAKAFFADMY